MTFITDTITAGNFINAEDRTSREAAGISSILCPNRLQSSMAFNPVDCLSD